MKDARTGTEEISSRVQALLFDNERKMGFLLEFEWKKAAYL